MIQKYFEGKTALVTGASSGIGREIAVSLARAGASLGLVARSRDGLEETRRLTKQPGARLFRADLRNEKAIARLGPAVRSRLGEIDILVNAAGVWHDERGKYHGPRLAQTPVRQIRDVLDVGLRAGMLVSRLFLPGMMRRRSGKILQIACGFAGPHEAVGWLHYYATNKAIEAFTAGLAAELREYEVQVNCLSPWFVSSEAVVRFFPKESKRALSVRDVARQALFLVSGEADHISGQAIELRSKLDHG